MSAPDYVPRHLLDPQACVTSTATATATETATAREGLSGVSPARKEPGRRVPDERPLTGSTHARPIGVRAFPALLNWLESLPHPVPGRGADEQIPSQCPATDLRQARQAAIELAKIVHCHAGPIRIGACTVDEPIELPELGAGWQPVTVTWPVLTQAVDVVLVGYSLTADQGSVVDAQARARMRGTDSEPAPYFHVVEEALLRSGDATRLREVVEHIDQALVEQVRLRRLSGEVAALRQRFPKAGLPECAYEPSPHPVRVAVISPDSGARESWLTRARLLGEIVSPLSPVDVIIAVAPGMGWRPRDKEVIAEAVARAGVVFVTRRLPSSWRLPSVLLDDSATAEELDWLITGVLKSKTPGMLRSLARAELGGNTQAAVAAKHNMLLRRRRALAHLPEPSLKRLAKSLGLGGGWRAGVVEALVLAVVAAGGLVRLGLWPAVAIVIGGMVASLRLAQAKRVWRKQLMAEIAGEMGLRASALMALPRAHESGRSS